MESNQKVRCPYCGDDDIGQCTEQANCLNVSLQVEMDARKRKLGETTSVHLADFPIMDLKEFPDGH